MKMSTKAKYGLNACIKLAMEYDNGYIAISDLSKATGVSDGYLEQIMSLLKKDEIVLTLRGATGGYKLSSLPSELSVGRVLRALEDNLEIVDCISSQCKSRCNCVSRKVWDRLYQHINEYLNCITLQQLIDESKKVDENETNLFGQCGNN